MPFTLPAYHAPDFTLPQFQTAPDARFTPAPQDGVAPEGYHATSIFPEYFKVDGQWLLVEESRMDCVAVLRQGIWEDDTAGIVHTLPGLSVALRHAVDGQHVLLNGKDVSGEIRT